MVLVGPFFGQESPTRLFKMKAAASDAPIEETLLRIFLFILWGLQNVKSDPTGL